MALEERWDELLAHGLEVGLSIEAFWNITPRELRIAALARWRSARRDGLFIAWHTAALTRTAQFPTLEELLAEPKTEEEQARELADAGRDFDQLLAIREKAKVKLDG